MRTATLAVAVCAFAVSGFALAALVPSPAEALMTTPSETDAAVQARAADGALAPTTPTRSTLEDGTGVQYQADGGIHGDAPDTCSAVDPARQLIADGGRTSAMLVDGDDESDAFAVPLNTSYVGQRMLFDLALGPVAPDTLRYDIMDSACTFSVFDPDADIYHPERNVPAEPFTDSATALTYDFDPDQSYGCGGDWRFLVKHTEGATPSSLYVEWSNGDYTYILHDPADPSQVSKYDTGYNLDNTITRLAVQMPAGWVGDLSISHGPCNVTAYSVEPPTQGPSSGEFTVVEPDQYVLVVSIDEGILDGLPTGPSRCHDVICAPGYDLVAYDTGLRAIS